MKYLVLFIFATLFICDCTEKKDSTIFEKMDAKTTGIEFENTVNNLHDFNIFGYRNFYNGGGVAIGDIDNDGFQDILFTSNMGENQLYLNQGNFTFKDITAKAGVADVNKWSTGAAMVDINNDGWIDIYICNAGVRQDSDAKNTLYINNGDQTFTESAAAYGLDEDGYTTHAAFFDYDQDGDLDVYILNNSFIPVNTLNYSNKRDLRAKDWPVRDFLKGGGDKLFRNDNGKFTDVSEKAGIYGSLIGFGLGVTVGDVNGDLFPDIYVSNDFFERDYLYINKGDGSFSEELESRVGHTSMSSMGADLADINNDGSPELFVTDMLPDSETRLKTTSSFDNINVKNLMTQNGFYNQYMQNSLQLNDGGGNFKEMAFHSGVAASDWSWGALMFDVDQDMNTDIFVCNGIYHDVTDQDFIDFFANDIIQKMVLTGEKEQLDSVINRMPSNAIQNFAFRNRGDCTFENVSDSWGLKEKTFSNGAAYADLDNDGDLDLVINNVNQKALVYKNNSREMNDNNFIGFGLKGDTPNVNMVGTVALAYTGNKILRRDCMPNRGFQSSVDMRLNFGLGKESKVDSVVLIWPDRTKITLTNPTINTYHNINKRDGLNIPSIVNGIKSNMFTEVYNDFDKHEEEDFNDFYYERNVPVMLSKEGPKMSVGNFNNDEFDDLYICGAAGQEGQLYIGTPTGFMKKKLDIFKQFVNWEDTEALFFDANGDGYDDLFVGSGGNNGPPGSIEKQDRLYINTKNGNFQIDYRSFPLNGMNTSKAVALDYDKDGDMDLFVASRSYPGEYGMTAQNFLYQNLGKGMFTEVLQPTESGLA
ncbi:MAG: VCBS repeat-containing protein, partial [Saprospiraceae bacterium]